MYVALARTVLTDLDRDKIDDEVRNFRSRYPEYSRDDLVNRLIHHTAVRCGVIGAVASAPPGFLAVLPLDAAGAEGRDGRSEPGPGGRSGVRSPKRRQGDLEISQAPEPDPTRDTRR